MTILSRSKNLVSPGWQRLIRWLQAFDEAIDSDPVDRAIGDLNHRLSELEKIVYEFKDQ